jgi:hypothetical protein
MPRVLIPSDNHDWVVHWVNAYVRAGWEVVTGTYNFELRAAKFDLVHLLWPEELCQWSVPSPKFAEQIISQVRWWATQCPTIATVCNFYPHGYEKNAVFYKLYNAFYQYCSLTVHFSQTSLRMVREEFPGARHERHLVVNQLNYADLLSIQKARGPCRIDFGFSD